MFDLLEKHIRSEIELKPELQQQLRDSGTLVLLKKGEYLLREGEVCRHGYFMNKGSMIQLFQHENGKEIVLGFFMNEHYSFVSSPQSYFSAKGSTFGIRAIEDCELIAYRKEDLESMAGRFAEFGYFYHKITANALHNTYFFSAMRLSLSAEDFLAFLMKNHAEIMLRIPDKYIARFIGVSDEWLSKVKKKIIKNL